MGVPRHSIVRNVCDPFISSAAATCPALSPANGMALCIRHGPPCFLRGWRLCEPPVLSGANEGDVGRRVQRDKGELPISADNCECRYPHFNDYAAPAR